MPLGGAVDTTVGMDSLPQSYSFHPVDTAVSRAWDHPYLSHAGGRILGLAALAVVEGQLETRLVLAPAAVLATLGPVLEAAEAASEPPTGE